MGLIRLWRIDLSFYIGYVSGLSHWEKPTSFTLLGDLFFKGSLEWFFANSALIKDGKRWFDHLGKNQRFNNWNSFYSPKVVFCGQLLTYQKTSNFLLIAETFYWKLAYSITPSSFQRIQLLFFSIVWFMHGIY